MLDINALLSEVSDHPPCGSNLEYDDQFKELEQTAKGRSEQQMGNIFIAAVEPDWTMVKQAALALFSRTKDLRVAVLLTRALVKTENMSGLCDGLSLVFAMLDRYWETVHPRFDSEEKHDFTMRLNVLAPLADKNALLSDVRDALFVRDAVLGRIAIRDILIAVGKQLPSAGEVVRNPSQIVGVMAAVAVQDPKVIEATKASINCIKAIQTLLTNKIGMTSAIDLSALDAILACVVKACDDAVGVKTDAKADVEAGAKVGSESGSVVARSVLGDVCSREDAMRQLDMICTFFERTEPGNPAPLLIRRAQRLLNKNFFEIIQDMAPESLKQIRNLAGLKDP